MSEIINARISGTSLGGKDGNGTFMAWLYLEWPGAGVGFGGYGIDEWSESLGRRRDQTGSGLEFIRAIMETVGVEQWEDLKGKYIRVDTEGLGGKALRIGNLLEDKWFDPKEFFENERKEIRNGR